jgi:hypothetical protein
MPSDTVYLNNCNGRDHARFYPPEGELVSFYDLGRRGEQATKAVNLAPGTECIVAAPHGTNDIRFEWFAFSHEAVKPAPEGVDVRVFYGTRVKSVILPKSEAASTLPYSTFFDARGGFKRGSVIAAT